ncbi:MAG TPA: polyprenyl synthetase family protein, partial [Thermoanaerobaculia bacterium]|nr:polyprenyl synthetase family protein [Thermoanaerobaculia bacterium]
KTAHLFSAACTIPSLIRPADADGGAALTEYGEKLGVCFQLVDDLLDFTAREAELGKPVLSDLKEGKLTLPLILLLPRLDPKRRRAIELVLEDGDFRRTSREEILELVNSAGTIEEVSLLASDYAREARAALSRFPASGAREALESAPDFVLRRRS